MVTTFSLRLGLYFRGVGDCIGLRPILWRCKVRNRWNLAGFSPENPPMANLLKKKKEQIALFIFLVNPPGLEPGTPTLKVLCSTC